MLLGPMQVLAQQGNETILVTLTHANVCYNATAVKTEKRGLVLDAISAKVPCDAKPAKVLPVFKVQRAPTGNTCGYLVGKMLDFATESSLNWQSSFTLVAPCPVEAKK